MVGVYWYVTTCTYGPSKLLHQSVQCAPLRWSVRAAGAYACMQHGHWQRGPLPSSSAPCLHLHVTAQCLSGHHVSSPMSQLARPAGRPDHHHACARRDRPMHWHGDLLPFTLPVSLLVSSIAYSEGKKRNRAGGQRLAAWLAVVTRWNPHMSRRQKSARHGVLDR